MNKLSQYVSDSWKELKKVIWPTKQQAIRHTGLVIAFSLALAAFLGLADYVLNQALELVI